MSRFQKIFLASALLVVGFGVAKFLGQPVLPSQVFNSRGALPLQPSAVVQSQSVTAGLPQAAGSVRLLPDSPISRFGQQATNPDVAASQPPRLESTLAPVLSTNEKADTSKTPRAFDFAPISSAPIGEYDSPRARLRNEAPRAVGVDPQSPAAIRRVPLENVDAIDPYKVSNMNAAPPLLNAGYADSGPSPPPAMPVSYTTPVSSVVENQFAPPPWPVPEDAAETRTHIVVDGDSLERLAGRYLSDPKRSREIFELNRETLSAPDLLPIGAELKIPERVASASWDRQGFQPNSANARPGGEVARENMTPVRPAAAPHGIIPRAQLAPPVMVQ